jgi:hypothetical protein
MMAELPLVYLQASSKAFLKRALPENWLDMNVEAKHHFIATYAVSVMTCVPTGKILNAIEGHAKDVAEAAGFKLPTYNHMFTLAFEVSGSTSEGGEDVTAQQLFFALRNRMDRLNEGGANDWLEAVGAPDDTHEEKVN